jgi:hypothetical protein
VGLPYASSSSDIVVVPMVHDTSCTSKYARRANESRRRSVRV